MATDLDIATHPDELTALEEAAARMDSASFAQALRNIRWSHRPAEDYVRGVNAALAAGAPLAARRLAIEGASRFPGQAELEKMADVLAPPKVIRASLPPDPALSANHQWFEAHEAEFLGKWVAVADGQLLGAAPALRTLRAQIGDKRATFVKFVPHLQPGQFWNLPTFAGLAGMLERLRFAVDPGEDLFYFGPLT